MSVSVLGISAYYHDSAAALLVDGRIVAAAQEERFTRIKGDPSFPHHAIGWCLDHAQLSIEQVDHLVFYEQPALKFERLFMTYLLTAPRGVRSFLHALPDWLTRKLWLEREIAGELGVKRRVWLVDHHQSHAASAFYPSPHERAAVLTIDGVGEWSTATWGVGNGQRLELRQELRFPNSLGLLYSAFTYYCGFKINSGEYKLMGLAPYGRPTYAPLIRAHLLQLQDDGAVILNQDYFNYATDLTTTSEKFHQLFGGPPRAPESLLTQREMDLAASIQQVLDEALERMARHVRAQTGEAHLVLAGGVALNCVATGRLSRAGIFDSIWTQPAAGDAGGALGAALAFWHQRLDQPRVVGAPDGMAGAFLGPSIDPTSAADDQVLRRLDAVWETLDDAALQDAIARQIAQGKVVAVARGPMEFGPRALGARSILGDARDEAMQSRMNLKIKFRESFRPFAPMVLAEDADAYFQMGQPDSPYMLLVYDVQPARRKAAAGEGLFGNHRELRRLVDDGFPVVTFDGAGRMPFVTPDVSVDCYAGGKLLGAHLLKLGRRRLCIANGRRTCHIVEQKMAGIEAAWAAAGLPAPVRMNLTLDEFHMRHWITDELEQMRLFLMQRGAEFDCLMAVGDIIAMAAMRMAGELGLRVPRDLAVVGYDGCGYARQTTAPLTTVSHDSEVIGVRGFELLDNQLKAHASGSSPVAPVQVMVAPRLVPRVSCGAALKMERLALGSA